MDTSDFDFALPDELIAQAPPPLRGGSRLLVLNRRSGAIEHSRFIDLGDHLRAGDLLVFNNTKVFPARLLGVRSPSGGAVECLLIRRLSTNDVMGGPEGPSPHVARRSERVGADLEVGPPSLEVSPSDVGSFQLWEALMHPGQKLRPGAVVVFERDGVRLHGEVVGRHFHGRRTIRLWSDEGCDVDHAIDRIGHVPLPPYIKREDQPADRDRYQTVYARSRGAVAAPTAGLHFTTELLAALAARRIEQIEVTLHVGYGTFKPIRVQRIEEHVVDAESFVVSATAAEAVGRAREQRRRIIAVGTTTVRVLESLTLQEGGRIAAQEGQTELFIHPGHQFRLVDGMITNFHLPRSSLLVLVAAFAGRNRILAAYREAITRAYRFYSYGDAMLIL
jgi:S-adenosylmethionine:tRNA ribosyltransferase-isomerase